MPAFSTTTSHDTDVASIVMMASMQKYFSYYSCAFICGIPSVTLLGEKADYELILRRLENSAPMAKKQLSSPNSSLPF
jgi:hypothetical protein